MIQKNIFDNNYELQSQHVVNMLDYNTDQSSFGQLFSDSLSIDVLSQSLQSGIAQTADISLHSKPSKVAREFREGVCSSFMKMHASHPDWHCGYPPKGKELGVCINYKHNYVLTFVTGGDMSGIFVETTPERVYGQPIGALRDAFLETKDSRIFFPDVANQFADSPSLYFVVLRYLHDKSLVVWEIAKPVQVSYNGGRVDNWDLRYIMPVLSLGSPLDEQRFTPIDLDGDMLSNKDVKKKA